MGWSVYNLFKNPGVIKNVERYPYLVMSVSLDTQTQVLQYVNQYIIMIYNSFLSLFMQEKVQSVYDELCGDVTAGIAFKILTEHPIIQDCVAKFTRFKQVVRSMYKIIVDFQGSLIAMKYQ